jgi:glycerophosphoryl diester phosphodiesterase
MNTPKSFLSLFRRIIQNLAKCWYPLVATSVFFRLAAFSILTPIVGMLFSFFLQVTGRTVLADADIAKFLLHPIGWLALAVVGGAFVCECALEQAALLTLSVGAEYERSIRPTSVLIRVFKQTLHVLRLAIRLIVLCTLICIPFLAVCGFIYWWLLTDYDINFYLQSRPLKFWFAISFIAAILAGMLSLLARALCGWIYALPLLLFEVQSPVAALSESARRAHGHRALIAETLVIWIALNSILNASLTICIVETGQRLLPAVRGIGPLSAAVGALLAATTLCQFVISIFASSSAASSLAMLYLGHAVGKEWSLPSISDGQDVVFQMRITRGRLISGAIICTLLSALIGAMTILSTNLEDRVEVTAHRGGAGVAPENTLAAIRKAIDAGADWVEVDVQESKDGVVVVVHDSDLKKLANNPVKIWEATADELRTIDIGSSFSANFQGEKIPTLDEVLQVCKGKINVNIELKYYGHNQQLEQRVIDMVEKHDMSSQIVVMSLKSKGIGVVKALRPKWQCGLLTAVAVGRLENAKVDFLAVKSTLATRKFIVRAHAENRKVYAWTLNDEFAMSTMMSRGVDNIVTDYPAMARRVLALRDRMSPPERLLIELATYLGFSPTRSEYSRSAQDKL